MAVKKAASKPSHLSEEVVHDSSDENDQSDEEEEDSGQKGAEDSSNTTSPEQSEPSSRGEGVTSSSESSDDDDNDSNGSDEDESSPSTPIETASDHGNKIARKSEDANAATTSQKSSKPSEVPRPTKVAAKPYKPPPDFESLALSGSYYASDAANLFSDMTGKELWHISAPTSLNITNIKQFDITAALKGDPIYTDGHVSYTMQPMAELTDTLLLPHNADAGYRASTSKISRGYSLQASEKKGIIDKTAATPSNSSTQQSQLFTAQAAGELKAPRQQPSGLKRRYTPFGVIGRQGIEETHDPVKGKKSPTKTNRTPSKPTHRTSAPVSDPMELDDSPATKKRSTSQFQTSAQPSPAKSTPAGSAGEKKKKVKKRTKLVDTPGL